MISRDFSFLLLTLDVDYYLYNGDVSVRSQMS